MRNPRGARMAGVKQRRLQWAARWFCCEWSMRHRKAGSGCTSRSFSSGSIWIHGGMGRSWSAWCCRKLDGACAIDCGAFALTGADVLSPSGEGSRLVQPGIEPIVGDEAGKPMLERGEPDMRNIDSTERARSWVVDYSAARAKAIEWLGDRYLLARPVNRLYVVRAAKGLQRPAPATDHL